jgi:tetratricopeptide (TPR) repeat protein
VRPVPRWGWHLLVLAALSLALYSGSLKNGFVSDDDFQVLGNPLITDPSNIPLLFTSNVWRFAEAETTNYYRPLHMLLYMAEYHLFGYSAFWWHFVNLLLHLAAVAAAYFLVRALGGEQLGFWAALWFALHPIHVEAVVWVAVVTDLLCGMFLFAGVISYHRARSGGRPALFHALTALAFFAALLVKETALVFPALLVAYEFFYRRESPGEILSGAVRYAPLGAVFAVYLAMRLNALGAFAPATGMHVRLSAWEAALSVPVLLAQYAWKLIAPVNLNYYYVFEPVRSMGAGALAGVAVTVGLLAAMFRLRRAQPLLAFSLAWFLLTLAPVLSIQNVGENVFTERYLYIPSLGFCVIAAWAWLRWRDSAADIFTRRASYAALAAVFVFYAAQTVRRIPDWRDDITLFSRTAEQSPHSATIQANLGYIQYLHGKLDLAIEHYRRSLALNDGRALTHNNLGNALAALGRHDEAIASLRRALELKPGYPSAWLNLGLVYAQKKEWDPAIECYRKALEQRPEFPEAHTALGLALWNKGEAARAIESYRRAVALKPAYVEARINLASALSETGSTDEAIEHLLAALRPNPLGPHASVIHFNLGVNYERKGRGEAALAEFERALLLNPNFAEARRRLELSRSRQPAAQSPPLAPFPRR